MVLRSFKYWHDKIVCDLFRFHDTSGYWDPCGVYTGVGGGGGGIRDGPETNMYKETKRRGAS